MVYYSSIQIERPSIESLNGLPDNSTINKTQENLSPSNSTFDANSSSSTGFIGIKGEGASSIVIKYTHKSMPLPLYNNNGKFEFTTMFLIPFIILICVTIIFFKICSLFSHYIDIAASNAMKNCKK